MSRPRVVLFVLWSVGAGLTGVPEAGVNHWTTTALSGTRVRTLAIGSGTPSRVYAGITSGLFENDLVTPLQLRDDRFEVVVEWLEYRGIRGAGVVAAVDGDAGAVPLRSRDSTVLEFFSPDNWEMLLKVLDGRGVNGHHWVFLAAATDVEYTVEVTDTACGLMQTYTNPLGTDAPAITDTLAFATCGGSR